MKLSSVSTSRLLVFGTVQLARLAIACALCYGGSFFIAHTIALGNLILNCVALEFVVEIDDILYEAFAPQRLTETFQKAKTLQLPSTKKLWGLDPGPVLKLCATVVMIGVMAATSMKTQSQDLKDAGDAVCGGPVDWAYRVDKFGLPHYTTLGADVNSWLDLWGKDPFEARVWSRPAEEAAKLTLQSKFVDVVLTSPRDGSGCNESLCYSDIPQLDSSNSADTFPWDAALFNFIRRSQPSTF